LLDFDQADELIELGRKAIDEAAPQIETAVKYLT
jgi:hypothetical protein